MTSWHIMKIHEISIEMSWVELTLDSPGHQAHEQKPCLQLLGSIAGTGIWQLQRCFHGHFMDISWDHAARVARLWWQVLREWSNWWRGGWRPLCGVLWHYGIVWELRIILILLIFYDILIFLKSYFHLFSYSHYNILPHVQRSFPRL